MTDREVMQQALDALIDAAMLMEDEGYTVAFQEEVIITIRARLAQPESEPVAWLTRDSIDGCWYATNKKQSSDDKPLYTAPPKREWVGMTDDEYELMAEKRVTNYFFNTLDYAHDIEAMLKEKNGG